MFGKDVAKIDIKELGLTVRQHLLYDPDRHGKPRYYFRKKGHKKVRLRAEPGSKSFLDEFQAAMAAATNPQTDSWKGGPARKGAPPRSLGWLFNEYESRSKTFKKLGATTKQRRRVVMDQICAEPTSDKDPSPIGLKPLSGLRPRAVDVICQRCPTPATINARLKAFREALKFAVAEDWIATNPAREVAYTRSASDGYHTWTVDEVAQYESVWPVGTIQRLALAMLMFTGARRSDAVLIGKQHRKTVNGVAGWQFTQFKGRDRTPVTTWIPILPILATAIEARPATGDHMAYLETSFHKPFTAKGFGTQFKKWCKQAKLPHCSAHGLRKAAATIAAENGATAHQLMAIFGWRSISQALVYTKAAEQKRLAAQAMHMLVGDKCPTDGEEVSHRQETA